METSRIQVDCLEDMDYLVNNLSSYLLSQFPEENTLIDQTLNDLLLKLGPNIEISGIPYDTILLANKKSENQEDARDGDVEYERLDVASHDKLLQCTNTFEEDLKMYLMMRKEMPLQIQAAFLQKLQFIARSLEDGDEDCEETEEKILEKLVAFENNFNNNIHSQKVFHDMIEDLSHDLSKYSHLEKDLPMLNAKFMRAKTILKEEIEMTQSKLQSGAEAESQDVILKGISAAQQRLKELNAVDDSDDIEDQENTNTNRLKRRKSLIEKQLEMKEHVQCVQIFLNSLSTL